MTLLLFGGIFSANQKCSFGLRASAWILYGTGNLKYLVGFSYFIYKSDFPDVSRELTCHRNTNPIKICCVSELERVAG